MSESSQKADAPKLIRSYRNLGNCLIALGRLKEARGALERSVALAEQLPYVAGLT